MATMTKIRGNTQIMPGTISAKELNANAEIELAQLKEGAELIKRDGSVEMTGDLKLGGKKISNVGDAVLATDAITKRQLDAAIGSIPDPMEFKGEFDASAGILPATIDNGDTYVVTVAGTVEGVELQVGAELIAKTKKASGVTIADFVIANRMDQVVMVNGHKGVVELAAEDLVGLTATTAELNQLSGIKGNVQSLIDGKLDVGDLVTDATFVNADDITIASTKATKVYVDTAAVAAKTYTDTRDQEILTEAKTYVSTLGYATTSFVNTTVSSRIAMAKTELRTDMNTADEAIRTDMVAADTALGDRVTALEGKVTTDVSTAIAAEQTRATAAEDILTAAIAKEVTDRTAADTAITNATNTAITTVQGNIDTVSAAVTANKTDIEGKLAQEVTDRTAAVKTVADQVVANKTDIEGKLANEVTRATAAEAAVQISVDAEAARAKAKEDLLAAADVTLQGNIDALAATVASASVPVDNEIPTGVIDGVNREFALMFVPVPGSTHLYQNGMRQTLAADRDYVIVPEAGTGLMKVIRFNVDAEGLGAPAIGDTLVVDYRK